MSGLINVIDVKEFGGDNNEDYWFSITTVKTVDYSEPYFDFGEYEIKSRSASTNCDHYSFIIKTSDENLVVMLKMIGR